MKLLLAKAGALFLLIYYITHFVVFLSAYRSGQFATIVVINEIGEADLELGILVLSIIPASHLFYYILGDPPIIGNLAKWYVENIKKKKGSLTP